MRQPSIYFSDFFLNTVLSGFWSAIKQPRTQAEYFSYLCILCDYAQKDFLSLDESDVTRFFHYMYERYQKGTLSRKTINVRLSCYKSVSRYICEHFVELDFHDPFIRQQRFPVDDTVATCNVPSIAEMDKIMSAAKEDEMFYLIFALAGRAALSATAIISIRTSNIIETENGLSAILYPAKDDFHTDVLVSLPEDVSVLLQSYLRRYGTDRPFLFYNKYGNPLTLKNLDVAVKKYVQKSGVSREYTLKDIRSRAIVELSRASVPDNVIADYTGLTQRRVSAFKRAVEIADTCPAELVNYHLNVSAGHTCRDTD